MTSPSTADTLEFLKPLKTQTTGIDGNEPVSIPSTVMAASSGVVSAAPAVVLQDRRGSDPTLQRPRLPEPSREHIVAGATARAVAPEEMSTWVVPQYGSKPTQAPATAPRWVAEPRGLQEAAQVPLVATLPSLDLKVL